MRAPSATYTRPKSTEETKPAQRRPRKRSDHAVRALSAFGELRRFFAYDTELAQALDWDEATVADWRARRVVRPQRAKVAQVLLLLELCEEAGAYLDHETDVGAWLRAPLPNLRGSSPAQWLRQRRRTGLRELTYGMVDWMPKLPEGDLEVIDADQSQNDRRRAAEHDEGVREFERMLADLP